MKIKLNTEHRIRLSDTFTPVELYLKLRDQYSKAFLLESSDNKNKENSFTYICLETIASIKVEQEITEIKYPNIDSEFLKTADINIADKINEFTQSFDSKNLEYNFATNGLFGYTSYDAIPLFDDIQFKKTSSKTPLIQYDVFKYILVFNHFNNELHLIENLIGEEKSKLNDLESIINNQSTPKFTFSTVEKEISNLTNKEYLTQIEKGVEHCRVGDVFQIVLSRKYEQKFKGDDFNVYRALRSVNPSPYLFYFDYGDFKIFGSSPEAQLVIENNKATINPIAGTFKRTKNDELDNKLAEELRNDPKENAEHVMLIDLARNDLSKSGKNVTIDSYKKIEYYSHVIHLVSKVSAELPKKYNPLQILGETYPAGTLSGAPKHKAMQLIDNLENTNRGFYGGTVGYIGFNGKFNHAIFIRSFVSQKNKIRFQAGAGITVKSNPQSELEETENKLSALRCSIQMAKNI